MIMAWQTPKTDWAVRYDSSGQYLGDYFEATDYQRIKGNLLYLKEIGERVFNSIPLPDIPDITIASYGYASTIDALERSIDAIRDATVDLEISPTKKWIGNNPAPLYTDLNRIEGTILKFYNVFLQTEEILLKLQFQMNGSDF